MKKYFNNTYITLKNTNFLVQPINKYIKNRHSNVKRQHFKNQITKKQTSKTRNKPKLIKKNRPSLQIFLHQWRIYALTEPHA